MEGKGAARLTLRRSELEVFSEKIPLNGGSALFSHAVENPHLWSAEDPALYELEIELLDDAGPVSYTHLSSAPFCSLRAISHRYQPNTIE